MFRVLGRLAHVGTDKYQVGGSTVTLLLVQVCQVYHSPNENDPI